ncbi:MAG: hypothetical protein Roseis2KO_45000 [Roseivirga sp.]
MKSLISTILMSLCFTVFATDIEVSKVYFDKSNGAVNFSITWNNAWKNSRNQDAAWVFIKFSKADGGYVHGKLASGSHNLVADDTSPDGNIVVPADRIGVFLQLSESHRGNVNWDVKLKLDRNSMAQIGAGMQAEVYAIEMVYVPAGGFTLGDPDPAAIPFNAFYQSDDSGKPSGQYKVNSEDQIIQVGAQNGALYYDAGRYPIYTGDQKGPVPATFPKGVQPFYIMKYETTQGLYTDFLNTLSANLAAKLSPHETEKYYEGRGSIKVQSGEYTTDFPLRPCNYITWDDGAALADWAGLRPMTELEYTKAARGPGEALPHEFPWNTDNKNGLGRFVDVDDNLKLKEGLSESNINDNNRHQYGASYYWVMDLAGSLWEKCVSIGHPIGRNFRGSHGDGLISETGTATNTDWPKGINEEGGYGYRGGGYYQHTMKVSEFNPHSPIAYRRYGAWSGGKRSIAYSQRYVRTAPQ